MVRNDMSTRRYGQRLGVLMMTVLFFGLVADQVSAGVAVAPLKQEISLRPGETGKATITLTHNTRNEFDPPQDVEVQILDVQVSEVGVLNFREAGTQPHSASRWLTLSATELSLEAGKSQALECI